MLIIASGLLFTLAIYGYVRALERRSIRTGVEARAKDSVELLRRSMLRSFDSLQSVASLFRTQKTISRQEFHDFVSDALARQPALMALGWTPYVSRAKRDEWVAAAVHDGFPDFSITELDSTGKIRTAGERNQYVPILYLEPEARNRPAIGFDLYSSPIRDAAIEQARITGQPSSTPPLRLIQENDDHLGFIVYQALYSDGHGDYRERVTGYASAVFRVDDLIASSVADLAQDGLEVAVTDDSAPSSRTMIFYRGAAGTGTPPDSSDLTGSAGLDVATRHWTIVLYPNSAYIAANSTGRANSILCIGLVCTALMAAYLFQARRRTSEIERRVVERTRQLSGEVKERNRAEHAARLAELKFRSIVENAIEGIFQTSLEGTYITANTALARIYGYESPQELITYLANIGAQLYVDSNRRAQFVEQIRESGEVVNFESQVRREDGAIIWISENARTVKGERGEILYYEGMVVEITERKLAEENLRRGRDELEQRVQERTEALARSNEALQMEIIERKRAEEFAAAANHAKTRFLTSVSHEIRTPMNAIIGYAQILQRDTALLERHRDALETIAAGGDHLMNLINDVLDLSKIEAGHEEVNCRPFDLGSMVRQVAGMLRCRCREKGIDLHVKGICSTDDRWIVRGDEVKLRQVLINLLGNAVKFTDHGSVTLEVRPEQNRLEQDEFRFEVSDTGIGIPDDELSEIFEPFRQVGTGSQRGGSGLGLAITNRLINLMGGTLACASQSGNGSRFYFVLSLPVAENETPVNRISSEPDEEPSGFMQLAEGEEIRALVVDDIAENRLVLVEMLQHMGCEACAAADETETLYKARSFQPHIVFMDIMMPGWDGPAIAKRLLQEVDGSLKIVATSAAALEHEQQACSAVGFDDFIAKPIRFQRLHLSMSALLGARFVTAAPVQTLSHVAMRDPALPVGLPALLRQRLLDAASLYRVTDLRHALAEVDSLGPEMLPLAQFLRQCLHRYDLPAISRVLATPEKMVTTLMPV